ncbi:AAA family ATPase [Goodfellowiella coeruleoviolacea]|uniref:AAA family ATPase n=1 Tax=Goodfellowiella coeruleoviolacea TaxID=334858 RepID=UPI000B17FF86|nr:LuxR family transcriptional regulator [Goodfellowiella coeruleoviolacea]
MDEILGVLGSPTRPPLVTITGPAGVGRTALLARLRDALADRGVRTTAIRFTPDGSTIPTSLALPRGEPHQRAKPPPPAAGTGPTWSPIRPAEGAHDNATLARWAAAATAARLLAAGPTALLVDDVQWADADTLAVLEALVRRLAGTPVSVVCAVRTPATGVLAAVGPPMLDRLRRDDLVHRVALRPLRREGIRQVVRGATQAVPDEWILTLLTWLTRGIPAALHGAIRWLCDHEALRVVDRHAYLVRCPYEVALPADHELVRMIRRLGPTTWSVAKGMAVLHPLGAAAPGLIGEVRALSPEQVRAHLAVLVQQGVLHRGRAGASWRFTLPLVGTSLRACLGPFERRQLAAKAVTAIWTGAAHCADPDYLTDQVAAAGRLVDPVRARAELLGRVMQGTDSERLQRAERWLRAAVDLAEGRAQRATTLLMHASICFADGDYERSLAGAQTVLREYSDQLNPEVSQELQGMAVGALHSMGDFAALEDIVSQRRRWPSDAGQEAITRTMALFSLDRWDEARVLLAGTRDSWAANPTSAGLGELFTAITELWSGNPEPFERGLANRDRRPLREVERHRMQWVNAYVTLLLTLGDLSRAEKLIIDENLDTGQLLLNNQALLEALRGHADTAIDLARRSMARNLALGHDTGRAAVQSAATALLLSQGRLTTARNLLAATRASNPVLGHLLTYAEAGLDRVLGETERATAKLTAAQHSARERGLVIGTEFAVRQLAEMALDSGQLDVAQGHLAEAERIAEAMRTSRTALYALLLRAVVEHDHDAGKECLRVARERGQSLELAGVLESLVRYGVGDTGLLPEAYEIYGELGALLHRARLRALMREHEIVVPGRQATVAESERLLAVLVAEGLSNKQLATVLRISDKSVEGRLSRLFSRTGLRSRIELAAALLGGDYPA